MNERDDWSRFSAITTEELGAALEGQRVQLVNVLSSSSRMIPHSRHIPVAALVDRLGELDRGRDVVVYCAGPDCPLAREAARILSDQGLHVRAYEGGLEAWTAAGLPVEEGATARHDAPEKEAPRKEAPKEGADEKDASEEDAPEKDAASVSSRA